MKFKQNRLAQGVVGAVAVIAAGGFMFWHEGNAEAARSQAAATPGSAASPSAASAAAVVASRGGMTSIAGQTVGVSSPALKAAAEQRANDLLRGEKAAEAERAGFQADSRSIDAEQYAQRDVVVDPDGTEHVRMARTYRGLPVIGGDLVVHSRNGQLLSTSKTLDLQVPDARTLASQPRPAISQDQAIVAANGRFDGDLLQEPVVDNVYFASRNQAVLAYQVRLVGRQGSGIPADSLIYVDAQDGSYLGRRENVMTLAAVGQAFTLNRGKVQIDTSKVSATERPEGAGYVLKDEKRGGGETRDLDGADVIDFLGLHSSKADGIGGKEFYDPDNTWGDNQVNLVQRIGAEVHYGVAKTWDYYNQQYDRKGIYDDGKGVKAAVNINSYISLDGKDKTNAFWVDSLKTMFYLNGEAGESKPVIALDVAGHEMSHGVTSATANLAYEAKDSGGLNEASSDINGTLVEFFDNSSKDAPDYLIGESVYESGEPLRYMFKPSLDKYEITWNGSGKYAGKKVDVASYDCYPQDGFEQVREDPFEAALLDPHFTSGVGNHFFYLLSEGTTVPKSHRKLLASKDLVCSTGNTALKGIGHTLAGQIWYRALRVYMTEQTTYPMAREATQQAAADFVSRGLLDKKKANAVACAWEAVDVPLPEGSTLPTCQG